MKLLESTDTPERIGEAIGKIRLPCHRRLGVDHVGYGPALALRLLVLPSAVSSASSDNEIIFGSWGDRAVLACQNFDDLGVGLVPKIRTTPFHFELSPNFGDDGGQAAAA